MRIGCHGRNCDRNSEPALITEAPRD